MLYFLMLFFSFNPFCLIAQECPNLAFHQLEGLPDHLSKESAVRHLERNLCDYHQKDVQIRGFLYQREDGTLILSSEPNLKTCCLGSKDKISQQVIVESQIAYVPSSRSVTMQGYFSISPKWERDGTMTQLYKLEKAIVIPNSWPISSIVFIGIIVFAGLLIWVLMRKNQSIL